MRRLSLLASVLTLLVACDPGGPIATRAPEITLVSAHVWERGELRLVSPDFAGARPAVILDDTLELDSSAVIVVGLDSVVVHLSHYRIQCLPGWHTVAVRVGGVPSLPLDFAVHGSAGPGVQSPVPLISRPLPLGMGSSKLWVGTAQGLAVFDAQWPTRAPILVDSTVDPACLAAIGSSSGGAVVAADRGCGTLRARSYGATTIEVDSGPSAAGWRYALNHPPGVWLLESRDSVALAVRGAGGAWTWTRWAWAPGTERYVDVVPAVSADGHLAVLARGRPFNQGSDVLVFDLAAGVLLYRLDSPAGAPVAFSPSGDTLVAFDDSTLVLTESRTGAVIGAFPGSLRVEAWGPIVWDTTGPWLYVLSSYSDSPTLAVFDRRTWSAAGWPDMHGGGFGVADGMLAVSGSTRTGWMLYGPSGIFYPTWVFPLTIPEP